MGVFLCLKPGRLCRQNDIQVQNGGGGGGGGS